MFLAVKHFLSQLTDHIVLIKSDNTTVVQYINKTGRNKVSPTLSSGMRSVAASTCLKAAPEHLGISVVQGQNMTHRMDVERLSRKQAVSLMGNACKTFVHV